MAPILPITDLSDPRLDVFARLTEAQLRNRLEPAKGVFIAESPKVISLALDAGYQPLSLGQPQSFCQSRSLCLSRPVGQPFALSLPGGDPLHRHLPDGQLWHRDPGSGRRGAPGRSAGDP